MKNLLLALALLTAFAPLAFAQSDCEASCCYYAGGSWDYDWESCDNPDSSYYSCINQCEGTAGFNYSCCGSAFILGAVAFGAFVMKR